MTLGEVIEKLSALPSTLVMRPGFGRPMSYRGVYAEVAFEPAGSSTVGEMLAHAKSAIGPVFEGYKGGDNTYDADTPAHVAEYGRCTEDGSMAMMFARSELNAEIARLQAQVADLTRERDEWKHIAGVQDAKAQRFIDEMDAALEACRQFVERDHAFEKRHDASSDSSEPLGYSVGLV